VSEAGLPAPTLDWTVHTDVFDGPLDLLLYLVRRDGIDLRRLEVAKVADAYLATLDRMRELHLGVAGDYLVMAATLVHLKSLELLPRLPTPVEEEDEGVDPREALARRLEAYQRYREAAEQLDALPRLDRDLFARAPEPVQDEHRPLIPGVDAFGLLDVYYELLKRQATEPVVHEVGGSGPDFEGCCRGVLGWLGGVGGRQELGSFLHRLGRPADRVVSFVAVLEMARLRWVDLAQQVHLGPVWVTSRVPVDHDLATLTGRLASESA
jgi:segregation and condensation protein A